MTMAPHVPDAREATLVFFEDMAAKLRDGSWDVEELNIAIDLVDCTGDGDKSKQWAESGRTTITLKCLRVDRPTFQMR